MLGISVAETAKIAGAVSSISGLIVIFSFFMLLFLFVAAGRRPYRRMLNKKSQTSYSAGSLFSDDWLVSPYQ